MSCPNMVWALYRPGLSPAERSVLVHMANVANRALVCFDPLQKIGHLLGMSIRTVHRAVHALEAKRLITIQARHRASNHYVVLIPESDAERRDTQPPGGDKMSKPQPVDGDKMSKPEPDGVTNCPTLSDKMSKPEGVLHAKLAKVPLKESPIESPKRQNFSNSGFEGSKPEREPTVAEIEARRAEHAETLAALPGPLADALRGLGSRLDKIAPLPGVRPGRSVDEQIEQLAGRPAVKSAYLSREQLALVRARSMPIARQPAYA